MNDGASGFSGNRTDKGLAPSAMTDIASTSSSGRSARQYPQPFGADIPRRIDVPVVARAAMSARPHSDIERHLVADRTTRRTRLGTRIPTVALDERLSGARGLVFEKPRERSPTRIGDCPSEFMILHHRLHIQIFNAYHLVFVDDATADFMKVVTSGARDALMRAGYQLPGFVPVFRSFFLARQFALFAFQVLLRLTKMARVLKLRSVARDGKMCQPDVDTDRLAIGGHRRHCLAIIGQDRRMVLATGIAADGHGLEFTEDLSMHDASHPTDFRQIDTRSVNLHSLRVLDGLATMLGLETRVFAALGKEVVERPCEVLQRLLQRLAVRVTKPFELLLELWQTNCHRMIVQSLARPAVEIARFSKSIVPCPSRAAKLNREGLSLRSVRIEADAGGVEHGLYIARVHLTSKRALYPGPQGPGFTVGSQ